MEALLDLSKKLDMALLEQVVAAFSDPMNPLRTQADSVLTRLRDHPDAWMLADTILDSSSNMQTQFFALQVLQNMIKYRWKALTKAQREGVRSYLVQKIISISSDKAAAAAKGTLLQKLNVLLVEILKYDWPAEWPSFISDLAASSRTSESLCENNVRILQLLSEEVFDFSKDTMASVKVAQLSSSLRGEFQQIFELFSFVLANATSPSLILCTLQALLRYVTWIPDQYIFRTPLLQVLVEKYLSQSQFRSATMEVLTEVGSLVKPEHDDVFLQLFVAVMNQLVRQLPSDVSLADVYRRGNAAMQTFIHHLVMFLTSYFRAHLDVLEQCEPVRVFLLSALNYLLSASDVDDPEIFKICLEYWLKFCADLYLASFGPAPGPGGAGGYDPAAASIGSGGGAGAPAGVAAARVPSLAPVAAFKRELHREVLSRLRVVMITHMAKPEEVLIEKDESGEIVREATKDTDAIAQYKIMRETLVLLTHLDPLDTENIMTVRMSERMESADLNWDALNTLCWAVGSISGAMSEADEKKFLITIIRDLLSLCENTRGKNNKAVVASNIMYVVGQYPRFLKAHWKFLKTVVMKLFEFMHEKHPGVQDMAVDTFLKIATKCKRRFVYPQVVSQHLPPEPPFFGELCDMLPATVAELQPHQVQVFFEAAGQMVAGMHNAVTQAELTERLMRMPNAAWQRHILEAAKDVRVLQNPEQLRDLQRILRINVSACKSIGPAFAKQLGGLYMDMLNVYNAVSQFVVSAIAVNGPNAAQHVNVKAARAVKTEILVLISTFVSLCDDPAFVAATFLPPLLEPVLSDYSSAPPVARVPEVLSLFTAMAAKLKNYMEPEAPRILAALFEPTLSMITANMVDFPEHRLAFFKLLQAVDANCPTAVFQLPPAAQKLVIDAVVWAFKHTAHDIAEAGLLNLDGLLRHASEAPLPVRAAFFLDNYLPVLHALLSVLTDGLHKAHFKEHASILQFLCVLIETGHVVAPLWESPFARSSGAVFQPPSPDPSPAALAANNKEFVQRFVMSMLASSFPHVPAPELMRFVAGLFVATKDVKEFKKDLRDFLITALQIPGEEAAAAGGAVAPGAAAGDAARAASLFAEEQAAQAAAAAASERARKVAIPGLLNPYERDDPDDDL